MNETRTITLRLQPGNGSNLLGLAGLLAIVAAIAGLAGPWWGVLTAGLFGLALAALAQRRDALAADNERASNVLHMPPAKAGPATARG